MRHEGHKGGTPHITGCSKESGGYVNIFLTDDSVVLAKPGMIDHIKASTGDEAGN